MGIFKWITSFFSSPAPIVEVKTAPAPKKVVKAEAPKKAVKKTVEPKVAKLTKASLSKLTKAQADYISVDVAGPHKPDAYRY